MSLSHVFTRGPVQSQPRPFVRDAVSHALFPCPEHCSRPGSGAPWASLCPITGHAVLCVAGRGPVPAQGPHAEGAWHSWVEYIAQESQCCGQGIVPGAPGRETLILTERSLQEGCLEEVGFELCPGQAGASWWVVEQKLGVTGRVGRGDTWPRPPGAASPNTAQWE